MKKFIIGYLIGGLIGYYGGDYMARLDIWQKLNKARVGGIK